MPSLRRAITTIAAGLALTSCDFLRGYAAGHSSALESFEEQDLTAAQLGAARFVFDDFGALNTDMLETSTLPWKLVAAALVLQRFPNEEATEAHLHAVMKSFGFLYPERIANWPFTAPPQLRTPLGIVSGRLQRDIPRIDIEAANLACAACHAGATYDATGNVLAEAWLGMPNTSLDLDAYMDAAHVALREAAKNRRPIFAAVKQLFPDVTQRELKSLDDYLDSRAQTAGGAGPVRNGGPGRSNMIDAFRFLAHLTAGVPTAGAVSTPQIGDQALRWSALADGVYTRRGDPRFEALAAEDAGPLTHKAEVVTFFSLPAFGLKPEESGNAVKSIGGVLTFLTNYQPPRYPGTIDEEAATRGAVIYARCVECHGEYVERNGHLALRGFPNRLSPLAEIGTDPARAGQVDDALVDAVESSENGTIVDAQQTRGYVAPNLAGLWATAPYLHNGSVPTLQALMTPAARPAKFWVGGHRLDFAKMGIAGEVNAKGEYAYPADYQPWSAPRVYDTALPGQSSHGHEHEFDGLTDADKADLIEFLKQL